MASTKSPAFRFYPKDFLTDNHVRVMTLDARGLYISLLAMEWLDGDLPADPEVLARMVGVDEKHFNRAWRLVRPCFQEQNGRLTQRRLEAEREKQNAYQQSASARGVLGNAVRWGKVAT